VSEPRTVRCAIYTRKSTEEGLGQNFNSLQAQREAGEAYIRSQQQSGWVALEKQYDDGGCSGANLERPALQRLLDDVAAGKVDAVVVYKVDRLSRSLLDFARLIGVFEQRGVSFVSVTQDFNTTTSMGRLTLNVLLSFAQFEREIISERTRDKLGAARRKGKWIGGIPILGYDVAAGGGRLIVNEVEAEQVRQIFAIAAAGESLDAIGEEIARRGIKTKQWTTRGGRVHEGQRFGKSTLRALLSNVLYLGSIRHKGTIYAGEQAAIVDGKVWQKVNRRLEERGRSQAGRQHQRRRTALGGLLACGHCGAEMVRLAATRHGRQYSYYGCAKAKKGGCAQAPVATEDLEEGVRQQVTPRFSSPNEGGRGLQEAVGRVRYHSGTRQVTITMRDGSQCEFFLEVANRPGVQSGRGELGRVPRISRLMALAIKVEGLVAGGKVENRAELARVGKISRARLSQILGLRNLTSTIQEKLLLLPKVVNGSERINEKSVRKIAGVVDWEEQERQFSALMERAAAGSSR
jgi:site-specific DNA recombinase